MERIVFINVKKCFFTRNETHDILNNLLNSPLEHNEKKKSSKNLYGEFKKLSSKSWISFLVKKSFIAFKDTIPHI